jgi:serine protease Do
MKNKKILITISIPLAVLIYFVSGQISSSLTTPLWRVNTKSVSLKIPSWAPIVKSSQPAVVVITTEASIQQPPMEIPGLPAPFRYYMAPPEKQSGQGSGFIINEDGYIITNQHVIEGAQKIKVQVGLSSQEYNAIVVGEDESIDIALLKIETKEKIKWPFLPLGDSDKTELGDRLLALGTPLGLTQSVNDGILSHKNRSGLKPSGRQIFPEMWQVQMNIAPGSSGGPMLNDSGEAVAVSESIISGQAIAFGVPINLVKRIIPDLLAYGSVEKAFLGVKTLDLTPAQALALGLKADQGGAIVSQVVPNTPAQKAGFQPMDVILEIDGYSIKDSNSLRQKTALSGVNKEVSIKIFRKGKGNLVIKAVLEKLPGQKTKIAQIAPDKSISADYVIEKLGLSLKNAPSNNGAQITTVIRGSIADRYDLIPGDIIRQINTKDITSASEAKSIIDSVQSEDTLLVIIQRENDKIFVPIRMP